MGLFFLLPPSHLGTSQARRAQPLEINTAMLTFVLDGPDFSRTVVNIAITIATYALIFRINKCSLVQIWRHDPRESKVHVGCFVSRGQTKRGLLSTLKQCVSISQFLFLAFVGPYDVRQHSARIAQEDHAWLLIVRHVHSRKSPNNCKCQH